MEDKLQDRQNELVRTIEAINEVLSTKAWQTLKELIWDRDIAKIDRLLLAETKKDEPQLKTIYVLQGEYNRSKRYDLRSYAEMLQKELQGIKEKQK